MVYSYYIRQYWVWHRMDGPLSNHLLHAQVLLRLFHTVHGDHNKLGEAVVVSSGVEKAGSNHPAMFGVVRNDESRSIGIERSTAEEISEAW